MPFTALYAAIDNSGNTVVQYRYDAWGNHVVVDGNGNTITATNNIGNLNPFRYRGYYYDTETGLYFLKSRYYDPEVGRFINMDSIEYADPESVNGINLYAYCGDNPVMGYDPDGTWSWTGFWNVVAAVAIVAVITAAVAFTAGAAAVAVGASTAVVTAVTAGAAVIGTVVGSLEIANQVEENGAENIDFGSVAIETFKGAAFGASLGYRIGNFVFSGGSALLAIAGGNTVSVGSTLAKVSVGLLGLNILFSTQRMGPGRHSNNQAENKVIDYFQKKYKFNNDFRRHLHDEISGKGYSKKMIEEIIRDLLGFLE